MDTERSRRHASKLLTYPITIASVLHQFSGLTLSNQRVTPEGMRSLAGMTNINHPAFLFSRLAIFIHLRCRLKLLLKIETLQTQLAGKSQ